MKKNNQQKILEASANLEIAKLFNALEEMKDKSKVWDSYWFDKVIEWIDQLQAFIRAFRDFKRSDKCIWKDVKFVNDIVDWIKSKSKYESRILELEARLERANRVYNKVINENTQIKNKLISFIDKFLWEDLDDDSKRYINNWLKESTKPLDKIIEESMKSYYEAEDKKCKINNEYPF